MNAAFFGLAGLAALNPKLLVVDLILAGNQRPRQMFLCFLLGGIGLGVAVGLLDVFVLHADALKTQGHASARLDLILGIALLVVGALLASNHLPLRRRPQHPTAHKPPSKLQIWADRVLHKPRYGLAVLIGAAVGTPGAEYLLALHHLVTGKYPTALQVTGVFVFCIINFALVIIPFVFFVTEPGGADGAIKRLKVWLTTHEREIAAAVALIAGGYMVISGLIRLS
jgi:hypothetical protein